MTISKGLSLHGMKMYVETMANICNCVCVCVCWLLACLPLANEGVNACHFSGYIPGDSTKAGNKS